MRFRITISLLAATATLAACGPVNRGLESVNQPVVSRTDYVFDIPSGVPSMQEQQRLAAWFDSMKLRFGDQVTVDDRSGYPNRAARDVIASVVARYGILLSDTAPVTAGSGEVNGLRVVVSRSSASVPNCPNWDRPAQPEFAGSTMSNYGCATNGNLASMVANPEDLVRGQSNHNHDAAVAFKSLRSFRDADPSGKSGLKSESR